MRITRRTVWKALSTLLGTLLAALLLQQYLPRVLQHLRARPDVVLISLDTVRRDALGIYRGPGAASPTPALDAFAEQAVVFDRAWSPIPFTLPAHLSMFTGLYPDAHGVEKKDQTLAPEVPTLGELFHRAGYETRGLHTNDWTKGAFGFARGFDSYQRIPYGLTFADRVDARALELIAARDGRPLFLFLHYLDAHSDFSQAGTKLPYYVPPRFLPRDEEGRSGDFCRPEVGCATELLLAADAGEIRLTDSEVARLHRLYTRAISALDEELGKFFDELARTGFLDHALVIVTSDHGEEFAEHAHYIHQQPFVETTAIPLLIRFPHGAYAGRRVGKVVDLVDLLPFLEDYLNLDAPGLVQGESFWSAIREGATQDSESGLSWSRSKLDGRYAVRSHDWSLVLDASARPLQLFDLLSDPRELHDVRDAHPGVEVSLQRQAERFFREDRISRRPPVPMQEILAPEESRRLRALGYLR